MVLFRFGYVWDYVADNVNFSRGKCTESVGLIMELSGGRTQGTVVIGCGFFKIMVSFSSNVILGCACVIFEGNYLGELV